MDQTKLLFLHPTTTIWYITFHYSTLHIFSINALAASVTKGKNLQVVHGITSIRLLGVRHNMWLDAKPHMNDEKMMMIAFITKKSSLVPLIEGLCAQI